MRSIPLEFQFLTLSKYITMQLFGAGGWRGVKKKRGGDVKHFEAPKKEKKSRRPHTIYERSLSIAQNDDNGLRRTCAILFGVFEKCNIPKLYSDVRMYRDSL